MHKFTHHFAWATYKTRTVIFTYLIVINCKVGMVTASYTV